MCLPASDGKILIGLGVSKTEYIDLETSLVEICCPIQGDVQTVRWYADSTEVLNSTKYVIGTNFLRISGEFVSECVMYTCRAEFLSRTVRQSTELCAGSEYHNYIIIWHCTYRLSQECLTKSMQLTLEMRLGNGHCRITTASSLCAVSIGGFAACI